MITISTRVRLARNIKNYPFPGRMSKEQAREIVDRVWGVLENLKIDGGLELVAMNKISEIERLSLVEEHMISPNLAANVDTGVALVSKNRKVSIMLNEEDHVRIQVIMKGQQFKEALNLAVQIDKALEPIGYSANEKQGYLTSCPTNVGTGLRVSSMLHLAAIIKTGNLNRTIESCNKLGIVVRGLYGENSEPTGEMVQVSNQVSLGQTEEELTQLVERVSSQIAEFELQLRHKILKEDRISVEDRVYRSYGLLQNVRRISASEALSLLSDIRAGVQMGILQTVSGAILDQLQLLVQPAILQRYTGRTMNPQDRDVVRADMLREKLKIQK